MRLDFEICKAVISLETFNEIWTVEDCLDNFEGFDGFYSDIENKTLTTVLNSRHPQAVHRSMKKHYPKLQKKYSNYTLVLETQKVNPQEDERLRKVKMYYQLEKSLEVTTTKQKMRKI